MSSASVASDQRRAPITGLHTGKPASDGDVALARAGAGRRVPVTARRIQITLGLAWLLDGLLQFKSFMYTHRLISEVFAPASAGQPAVVGVPMKLFDNFYGHNLTLWNTLAGEIQVAIGCGLILSRKTVKPALLASFGWALIVWWMGEGFGGLTANTLPAPLMGAPGAVILYAIIGLLVWPSKRPAGRSAADIGPLGDRGARYVWTGLWLLCAGLWLVNVNRANSATTAMIRSMATASPRWLANIQNWAANKADGHGSMIAIALAVISIAVAAGVWNSMRWPALAVGIVLSLAYWLLGQSLGGPFWTESATDVNTAPLFVLLAVALFPLIQTNPAGVPPQPQQSPAHAGRPLAVEIE